MKQPINNFRDPLPFQIKKILEMCQKDKETHLFHKNFRGMDGQTDRQGQI